MSDMRIRNGGHEGRYAKVTSDGQLKTYSSMEAEFAHVSEEHRLAFEFHPHSFSPLNTSKYIPVMWMKNTASDMDFHIEYVRFGWAPTITETGASAATLNFRMYRKMTMPTANATIGQWGVSAGPHNLYLGSEVEPEMDVRFWDNTQVSSVSEGMTIGGTPYTTEDLGDQINCGPVGLGSTFLHYGGALIMQPNAVLGVGLKPGCAGGGIVVIAGYFKEAE